VTILILDVDPSSPALWGFAIDPKLSLADIIASLTLLATVVIAWAASRSAMKQWRVQRRLEKAADVAEQAMVAVNQLTNFLQAMAHGVYFGEGGLTSYEKFERQWAQVREFERDFLLAEVRAENILGDSALQVMRAVWKLKAHLWAQQMMHARQVDESKDNSWWKAAYGPQLPGEILKVRNDARDVFIPIVRLEQPPGWFARRKKKPKPVRHEVESDLDEMPSSYRPFRLLPDKLARSPARLAAARHTPSCDSATRWHGTLALRRWV
jgi:hypothetical protein